MEIKKTHISFVIILFSIAVLNNQLRGQTIKIQSFDGKSQTIKIAHDSDQDLLTIATLKDTVHIEDCTSIEQAIASNKNFVRIIYQVRGGSGIHVRRMIILTSKNNKLYQSLHIIALFKEEFIDYSKDPVSVAPDKSSLYEVKINLTNTDYHNEKMIGSIHSEEKLKDSPQKNYNREKNVSLNFDTTKNIFYNNKVNISQSFTIYDPKIQKERKQYIAGMFPIVRLGTYEYYYIKGEWYQKGDNNDLSKYAY